VAPVAVYRALRINVAQGRLGAASVGGLTPFIGRGSEMALLVERWTQVKEGTGHVVLLSSEAGIGKARLVQVLKDHAVGEAHTRLECHCSPYHQNSAHYSLIDLLPRTLRWQENEAPAERLEKLEHALGQYRLPLDETVPLLAALLSLPLPDGRYPPLTMPPQRQKQKTLEAILMMVLELAERQPVLFVVEDLHWIDPSTLEFLSLRIEQGPTVRLLTLLPYRPTVARARGGIVFSKESRVAHHCRTHGISCVRLPDLLRALWGEGIVSQHEVQEIIRDLQVKDRMQFTQSTLHAIFAE
jgi:AAA ATPase-like protein